MSTQDPGGGGRPPTEEELLAAYEEQVKQLRVDDVVVQTIVSLLNLAARRAGLVPGSEDERDLAQVRTAIEAVRGLVPLVEDALGPSKAQLRDALAHLQVSYARLAGEAAAQGSDQPAAGGEPPPDAGGQTPPPASGPGPAERTGRLWVPGQPRPR
jgi:hypothetical protein